MLSAYLEKLLQSYSAYFDISRDCLYNDLPVAAKGVFHSRSEKYVLVKKAAIWSAEANEYIYFVMLDRLTAQNYTQYSDTILKEGLSEIKPHKEHMYSYVTLVILTDHIAPGLNKCIARTKYHKDYKFSFYGWMDYRIAAFDCTLGQCYTNRAGRGLKKMLHSVWHEMACNRI